MFNVIKRIINYMVSSVTSQPIRICYSDDALFCKEENGYGERLKEGIDLLNKNAEYRFDRSKMDVLIRQALLDAAISGNGVFYTYWDADIATGQPFTGDIKTVLCDNVDLFVANVNRDDIQSQPYVMLCGRDTVEHLCEEAEKNGLSPLEISKITPDEPQGRGAGDMSDIEGEGERNCTYLIKFYRDGNGFVNWQKSTRSVVIAQRATRLKRYPIASFAWERTKGSYIGTSPVTSMIENQKYINKAYAMVMKHMTDTAFSKVVYDKTLIPEWSNEVGEAIGVRGGDVRSAASIIGTGELQSGFLEVISMTLADTKELLGATDAALGEVEPDNTSAIIALQESSEIPLETLRQGLYSAIEDIALSWSEMLIEYCPSQRLLPYIENGVQTGGRLPDKRAFCDSLINARVDIGAGTRYSQVASLNTLDKLLSGGHITAYQYLKRLPDGIIPDRDELLDELKQTKGNENEGENTENGQRAI